MPGVLDSLGPSDAADLHGGILSGPGMNGTGFLPHLSLHENLLDLLQEAKEQKVAR
ncbi:hypothetical protein GCM10010524_26340 [Streptomyces mexicanus]